MARQLFDGSRYLRCEFVRSAFSHDVGDGGKNTGQIGPRWERATSAIPAAAVPHPRLIISTVARGHRWNCSASNSGHLPPSPWVLAGVPGKVLPLGGPGGGLAGCTSP
ncbi:unnamed protein product [Merluccius merluccius]